MNATKRPEISAYAALGWLIALTPGLARSHEEAFKRYARARSLANYMAKRRARVAGHDDHFARLFIAKAIEAERAMQKTARHLPA